MTTSTAGKRRQKRVMVGTEMNFAMMASILTTPVKV